MKCQYVTKRLCNATPVRARAGGSGPGHHLSGRIKISFAAILPIWDLLLGDYHRPEGFPPTGYSTRPLSLKEQLLWPLYHGRSEAAPAE